MTNKMPPDPLAGVSGEAIHRLNDGHRIICALIARGMSNKAIAELFNISLRTVESRRKQAADALDIDTEALVLWAARNIDRLPDKLPGEI